MCYYVHCVIRVVMKLFRIHLLRGKSTLFNQIIFIVLSISIVYLKYPMSSFIVYSDAYSLFLPSRYLREEKIEIQFWLSWSNYTAKNTSFTRQQDRLVGSSFVDISSFSQSPKLKTIIRLVFSLFHTVSYTSSLDLPQFCFV